MYNLPTSTSRLSSTKSDGMYEYENGCKVNDEIFKIVFVRLMLIFLKMHIFKRLKYHFGPSTLGFVPFWSLDFQMSNFSPSTLLFVQFWSLNFQMSNFGPSTLLFVQFWSLNFQMFSNLVLRL